MVHYRDLCAAENIHTLFAHNIHMRNSAYLISLGGFSYVWNFSHVVNYHPGITFSRGYMASGFRKVGKM